MVDKIKYSEDTKDNLTGILKLVYYGRETISGTIGSGAYKMPISSVYEAYEKLMQCIEYEDKYGGVCDYRNMDSKRNFYLEIWSDADNRWYSWRVCDVDDNEYDFREWIQENGLELF